MRTLLAGLLCLPLPLTAQTADAPSAANASMAFGHKVAVPSATAARRAGPIVLDGKLDDSAWRAAKPITDFTQVDPNEGKPATQRTEVRFLFDDEGLYVGAKMYDTAGARGVTTRLVRRDGDFDSDYFEIVIDGYHDHLSRAFFDVNPSGSKNDNIGIGTSCCDQSWDPIWEAETRIDSDGWTAEIRIPYSQLRFSRDSVQTWGLQVRRTIKRTNEQVQWSFWGKTEAGGPSRFGHLNGLRIPSARSRLELLPYVVSKSQSVASGADDPFNRHGRPTFRAGLDLKDRLTSNLTLDATINPDFGQVEVDPAVLNLSAFETFFPEKRPFFVEGQQVFSFGNFGCNFCSNAEGLSAFYSRRVGRAPTGASLALDANPHADIPDATTILAAGKVTGRTARGFTVGLLDAVTGQANARVQTPSGARDEQEVEPLANYFVGRLKRDYMNGNLVVGGVTSGVIRKIDDTFAPRLAKHAEMYGGDLFYTWGERMFSVRAEGAFTNVSGDRRAILLRQRSSARYFQRPDRGPGSSGLLTNAYDSTATSLRGAGGYLRIAKETGAWFGEAAINTRTPGYEVNDYAFQQRADYVWYNANIGRFLSKPTNWYRSLFMIAGGQIENNFDGDKTQAQLHGFVSGTTPQFWNYTVMYIHRPRATSDRQLRGGPTVTTPRGGFGAANISTDSRYSLVGGAGWDYGWDERGSVDRGVSFSLSYRPVSNVSLSFGPGYSTSHSYAQYVSAIGDAAETLFSGTRYVFSNLDQRTLGLDTRLNVTFSPGMSLQLYVQPFFASGRYTNFKEYVRPRTMETAVYGRDRGTVSTTNDASGAVTRYTIDPDATGPAKPFTLDNPDFTQQSLRGNAVYRWEYRPGSVLYVAWTQSRFASGAFGDLDFSRDRSALFGTKPDNILLVKASWWLPR